MADIDTLSIPVILGTGRTDRRSAGVAQFVHDQLAARDGVETQLVDVKAHAPQLTTPPWGAGGADAEPTEWKRIAEQAHGFVIVTPEYNHGYPGELKLLLDALYDEYKHKPVGVCGVSSGHLGGARVVDHIKPVLIEFSMVPTRNAGYFASVKELFTDAGELKDPETHAERLEKMFAEIEWYGRALAAARS